MKLNWQKLASLAHEICTLWFQFFGAVFASKGYPFKNIFSQTIGRIELKYNVKTPYYKLAKICTKYFGHMTKMAATPIYGKKNF